MGLMPAWKKWGYDGGIEKGIEKGKRDIVRNLIEEGITLEEKARMTKLPVEEIKKYLTP